MACTENVFGGYGPSVAVVAVNKNGNKDLSPDDPLQCLNSMQKNDEDGAENWGRPRIPLRPPLNMLTDLAGDQLKGPDERTGSSIPDLPRAIRQPCGLPPAVVEGSLATEGVNSSEGLASWRLKGHDSINVSQKVSGSSPALMVGGTRVSSVTSERGGNTAKSVPTLPRGQGFFPLRRPQVRGPSFVPTLRSGIMMEVPLGNTRMACNNGRLAHVSFPPASPRHPRPMPMSSSVPGLPCSTSHCFIPAPPPSFNPFFIKPIAFAPPPVFGPPLSPYFAHLHSGRMPFPASLNKELK
ncbi:proline-rich protein 32 [Marmota flaviventris]|uniref:proline-rich protein 32 n=1 Tax=Marmota flaviventris TaxID=93162 RepID=UPI000FFFBDEB|nr:proline-rich protein 32 [Marmota flaviventris]